MLLSPSVKSTATRRGEGESRRCPMAETRTPATSVPSGTRPVSRSSSRRRRNSWSKVRGTGKIGPLREDQQAHPVLRTGRDEAGKLPLGDVEPLFEPALADGGGDGFGVHAGVGVVGGHASRDVEHEKDVEGVAPLSFRRPQALRPGGGEKQPGRPDGLEEDRDERGSGAPAVISPRFRSEGIRSVGGRRRAARLARAARTGSRSSSHGLARLIGASHGSAPAGRRWPRRPRAPVRQTRLRPRSGRPRRCARSGRGRSARPASSARGLGQPGRLFAQGEPRGGNPVARLQGLGDQIAERGEERGVRLVQPPAQRL